MNTADVIFEIWQLIDHQIKIVLPGSGVTFSLQVIGDDITGMSLFDFRPSGYYKKHWALGFTIGTKFRVPLPKVFGSFADLLLMPITGSENLLYTVNGVTGPGTSFDPVRTLSASNIADDVVILWMIYKVVSICWSSGLQKAAWSLIKTVFLAYTNWSYKTTLDNIMSKLNTLNTNDISSTLYNMGIELDNMHEDLNQILTNQNSGEDPDVKAVVDEILLKLDRLAKILNFKAILHM